MPDTNARPRRLDASESAAFRVLTGRSDAGLLVICDHASNAVPDCVNHGDLGVSALEMERHIAYDIGARGLTLALAQRLESPAVLSTFSRLVVDPNRGLEDPTLVMRLYDGTVIPANQDVEAAEIRRRLDRFYHPYHAAVVSEAERLERLSSTVSLISIHSFTPRLQGREPRPWHVGLLWYEDDRLFRPLMKSLRAAGDLCIGDNEPYTGYLENDTLNRHGLKKGRPHILIEVRQDLIAQPADQEKWADRLAPMLREAVECLC